MIELLLIAGGFILGAVPFAVLIGRYGLRKDIRQFGDGNPGAFNVLRAGGFAWAGLAIFLEIGKGALTVGLAAYVFHITGPALVAIALAPPLGHAYSPFLRFRGGKAIAAIGGVWIGLTLFAPVLFIASLLFWYALLTVSGWAVMLTTLTVLAYLAATGAETELFVIWALHVLLLVWKHREDLRQRPGLRMLKRANPS